MHAWTARVCVTGFIAILAAAAVASLAYGPTQFAKPVVTALAGLASDPNDPNEPNETTGIGGVVGFPDPNEPNAIVPIRGAFVFALQDGEITGSAMTGGVRPDAPGAYLVSGLEPGTYDVQVTAPRRAVKVVTGIEVQSGVTTVVNFYDLCFEGRICGRVTGVGGEPLEPNRVHVWTECSSGVLLMVGPDAEGNYLIENVPAGTYTVEAHSLEASFTSHEGVAVAMGATTSGIDFAAISVGGISGRVEDSQAQPIDPNEVCVAVDCGPEGTFTAEPNADGAYTIKDVPVGTFTVTVLSLSHSFDAVPDVVVEEAQTTPNVNFTAAPAGMIAGSVVESDGTTPIADAFVTILEVSEGRALPFVTTDPNGAYILRNVPPGTDYTVVASVGTGEPNTFSNEVARTSGVAVTTGQTTSPVNLVAPAGAISGSVSPAVEGALVRAIASDYACACGAASNAKAAPTRPVRRPIRLLKRLLLLGGGSSPSPLGVVRRAERIIGKEALGAEGSLSLYETTTDSNGDYTLTRLPPGTYEVSLEAPGYFAPKLIGIEVAQGETTGHDFTLTPEGAISGVVTDTLSAPIAGAVVVAMDPNADRSWLAPAAMTDEDGVYALGHLAAGTYIVCVDADGHDGDSTPDVAVTAAQTTGGIDFSLGSTASKITGTVYESDGVTPIPGTFVACYGEGLTMKCAIADEVGSYELDWLMPGTYTVTAVAEGFQTGQITDVVVSAGGTTSNVDFQLEAEP